MANFKAALLSTLLHAVELAVCLGAALLIVRFFQLGSNETAVVVGVVLNALAKFARASDSSTLPDFVNGPLKP